MINHEFNKVKVADGSEIDLYAAFPDRQGDFPAVIILQEAFGISEPMRDVAEKFRRNGYAVVVPDLFSKGWFSCRYKSILRLVIAARQSNKGQNRLCRIFFRRPGFFPG